MNLGTNDLEIKLFDSPQEAPVFRTPEYNAANFKTVHVVGKGTVSGNPTLDLIFEDENGQKYIAMITAALWESVNGAIQGLKERTSG